MAGKLTGKYINDIFVQEQTLGDGVTTTWELSEYPISEKATKVFLNGLKETDYTLNVSQGLSPIATEFLDTVNPRKKFSSASNDFNFGGDFSGGGWFKHTSGSGNFRFIMGKAGFSTGRQYQLRWQGGRFRLEVFHSGGSVSSVQTSVLSSDTWYFCSFYYDFSLNEIGISFNGGAFTTASVGGVIDQPNVFDFFLGARATNDSANFVGCVDDPFMMNSVITPTFNTALYNSGNGLSYGNMSPSQKSLILSTWKMDEGVGTQTDLTGSNDLTDSGGGNIALVAGVVVEDSKQLIFNTAPAIGQEIDVKYIKG